MYVWESGMWDMYVNIKCVLREVLQEQAWLRQCVGGYISVLKDSWCDVQGRKSIFA